MLRRNRKRPMSEINVVPYIDVMLVLLIVFMIAAPMLTQGVSVELPQTPAEPIDTEQQEPLIVTVDAEGRIFLDVGDDPEAPITAEVLVQRVAAVLRNQPQTRILVRGDSAVNYGAVVRTMTLLQQAGAPSVGLVTNPPERSE